MERFGETVAERRSRRQRASPVQGLDLRGDQRSNRAICPCQPAPSCHKDSGVTIVSGLPLGGDHPMHPFIIDAKGNCMWMWPRDQRLPAEKPDARIARRRSLHGARDSRRHLALRREQDEPGVFAGRTLRDRDPQRRRLRHRFAGTHVRALSTAETSCTRIGRLFTSRIKRPHCPAEEMMLLKQGGDYGWPECYYDPFVQKLVLAPGIRW